MKINLIKSTHVTFALIASLVLIALMTQTHEAKGNGFLGFASRPYIATTTTITNSQTTIFNANQSCTARTISLSDGTGYRINFLTSDLPGGSLSSTTLSTSNGLIQLGNTTVTYEAGQTGCGRWTAIAPTSTVVTLIEYQ